jgi:hypothetical protein
MWQNVPLGRSVSSGAENLDVRTFGCERSNLMNRYEGRRVLINGGGSGISQATVLRVLAEGGQVVAADVNGAGPAATREQAAADVNEAGPAATREQAVPAGTGARLHTVTVDIADETSVRDASARRTPEPSCPRTPTCRCSRSSPRRGHRLRGPGGSGRRGRRARLGGRLLQVDGSLITGTEIRIDGGTHF